jgi:rsbT co-antagonist protein RsbR
MNQTVFHLPQILKQNEAAILGDWLTLQKKSLTNHPIDEAELSHQSKQFLSLVQQALQQTKTLDVNSSAWIEVRELLEHISTMRTEQGASFSETAVFVFSIKQPLFAIMQKEYENDAVSFARENWAATLLFDDLGLYTGQAYLKARESIIKRQQEELLELSTPVIKLWDGILALPMIGTLDSNRTQIVMESLLQKIIENDCQVAIIDITGVPNVDTLVAQHLLKTVTAARLMGTECLISGIRPQIAQTIVHLGVNLEGVVTKASLADAFKTALKLTGQKVTV